MKKIIDSSTQEGSGLALTAINLNHIHNEGDGLGIHCVFSIEGDGFAVVQ